MRIIDRCPNPKCRKEAVVYSKGLVCGHCGERESYSKWKRRKTKEKKELNKNDSSKIN